MGVAINALAPAVVRAPLVDALPEATVKYMTDKIPMGRCGELEEVAAMIAWIVFARLLYDLASPSISQAAAPLLMQVV